MKELDLFIKNRSSTAAIKGNYEDEGVFIDEPMIYEDLADHDPTNA